MTSRGSRLVPFLVALFMVMAIMPAAMAQVSSTACTTDPVSDVQTGLQNMGFESGSLAPWREGSKVEGTTVVGADTFGTTTVTPWEGTKMARLGESTDDPDKSQAPGPNEICQDFVVNEASERFAFNIYAWDYTGFDDFAFDVKVKNPNTGETLASFRQEAWDTDVSLKTTGWRGVELDLSGHIGDTVRLLIQAGGTSDSLYPFWAYVDSADVEMPPELAPVADVVTDSGSVMVDPSTGKLTIAMPSGSPSDLTISTDPECPGGEAPTSVTLRLDSNEYEMTDPDGDGVYSATIPADEISSGQLNIALGCSGADVVSNIGSIVLYDPSGIISDADTGDPIVGAEVTLFKVPGWTAQTGPNDDAPNTCQSNLSKAPGDPWNQPAPTHLGEEVSPFSEEIDPNVNPFVTNSIGYYGWNVAAGCWYVVVEADGYETLTSPVVGVPPEVTDLDLELAEPQPEDTTPPNTKIKKGPKGTVKAKKAKFKFTSTEAGSTFRCKLDNKKWKKCSSPTTYKKLKRGKHIFRVRAIDAAGNIDPSPAKRRWRIK